MTGTENLQAFLDEHGKKLDPLSRSDSGSALLLKLLGHRAHQVYTEAAKPWPEDSVELVHDLRVATRRMREALAIARPLVDGKKADRADRRARKLGRVLGERRIADVMIEEGKTSFADQTALIASLPAALEARRLRATKKVTSAYPPNKLLRHGAKVLALALDAKSDLALADIAGAHLLERTASVKKLLLAVEDKDAQRRHHALRIRLKRLRYASEILSAAFPEQFDAERMIEPLKALQDALGVLNDAVELKQVAKKLAKKKRHAEDVALQAFLGELDRAIDARWTAAHDLVQGPGHVAVAALGEVARRLTSASA
jgi:CHAD domain-containing protein